MMERHSRNEAGVKDGADCYRNIAGVRWPWCGEPAPMFKAAGARYRATPDGQGTFVHPEDIEKASAHFTAASRAEKETTR